VTRDRQRLPTRRVDVRFCEKGHDAVLVAPGQTAAYALNPTARAIWELCDGTTTIEELTDAICQVFDVTRPTATADVTTVLDDLTAADLVHWASDG
jgi:hypothetical protein